MIDSIKKGLPFGSILLYKDENKDNFRIIDGLQRSNTIYEFVQNPASFFNEDDIEDEIIEKIFKIINPDDNKEINKEKIVNIIIQWIKDDYKTMDKLKDIQYYECTEALSNEFPIIKSQNKEKEVTRLIRPMLQYYKDICTNMADTQIPAIVISGDEDVLPTIFERINSKGTQLTKWQIYAATWSDKKIVLNKEFSKIIDFNKERYEAFTVENDLEIDDFDPVKMKKTNELNTFEVIFGFGKMISEKYPHLFSNTKQINEVESIGFNLINACLALKNSEIKNLNIKLREIIGNDDKINKFLKEIINCIDIVDRVIAITTKFKSNLRNSYSPVHTEMQICSMIASIFINKFMDYTVDDSDKVINRNVHLDCPNKEWKEYYDQFEKNAIKTCLTDIIQSNWSGSGDRKLNNVILNKEYYSRDIAKEDIINIMKRWHDQVKTERREFKKIQSPKEAERAVLNIIYSNELTAKDQVDGTKYDIDHIAAKERMKKIMSKLEKNGELRLLISSIGNLCFLPENTNRSKKEKTIYQLGLKNIEEIQSKYTFTQPEDLKWIENDNISTDDLISCYNNFIDTRFENICDKLINVLYPDNDDSN